VASPGGAATDPPEVDVTTAPAGELPDPAGPEHRWPKLPDDAPVSRVPAGAWTVERIRLLDAEQAGR
jgi:hypothetical protein